MKNVSQHFKDSIKKFGREIDAKITYEQNNETIELGALELNSLSLHYEGAILKSIMKELEIESSVDIPIDTWINFKFGVKTYRNLFDKNNYTQHLLIKEDGTENPNSSVTSSSNFILVDPSTQYTLSFKINYANAAFRIHLYDSNKNWIQQATKYTSINSNNRQSTTIITTAGTKYVRFTFRDSDNASQNAKDIQFEKGNTATTYEEFSGEYEYIDFGEFKVVESERQEDTYNYKLTCYDKMIDFMKEYEYIGASFPITIRDYLDYLCSQIGINTSGSFANEDKELTFDPFLDADNNTLGYTYRDILDQIAEAGGTSFFINSSNALVARLYNTTTEQIDEKSLKDINVNFAEKYGPINSVVLSRSGEADNIYLKDDESIAENGLCEVKIIDNQIMNNNDRDTYLPELLEQLETIPEYYINDYSSIGICYFEFLDTYNVTVGENTYPCIMFNDEINITQGLEELVHTNMPDQGETDYSKADKTDRKINQAYAIVDKQNQTITNLVSQTTQNQQLNDERILELQERTNSVVQTLTTTQATIEVMQRDIIAGQETLQNNLVTIDINGINVSTSASAIQTLMTNEKFVIKSGNQTLAYFGYDTQINSTKAEMDNLTVTNYFIAGVHRVETFEDNLEERTGWFYIG